MGGGVGRRARAPAALGRLLRRLDIHPRKGLGQHFLLDSQVLRLILSAAGLSPQDTVVEVGPGLGVLTRRLAQQAARVVAVELDTALADFLRQELAAFPNVEIVHGDILGLSPASLTGMGKYKVVANLPYYITSPVLRHFLEADPRPELMVVMVQREVAEAIAALPGKLSLLAVSVQFYSRPQVIGYVPPESFYPPPKVHSAILRLEVYPRPPLSVPPADFFRAVAAGFTAPRKQLRNSLAQGLGIEPETAAAGLVRAEVDPRRRPQTLSLEEWARVWQQFPAS